MNEFLTNGFTGTGRAGKQKELGEDKKPGAFRDIRLDRRHTRRC